MIYSIVKDTASVITDLVNATMWFLPRTVMCFTIFPLFSQTLTAPFIRNGVAVAISIIPASYYIHVVDLRNRPFIELMFFGLREVAVGMMLGFTIAFPFFAFRAFGAFVDAWRGATFATLIDPSTGSDELVTEKLMLYAFTMLFISGPSLILAMQALYDSFLLLPPGITPTNSLSLWISTLIDLFTRYISYAFILSGPVFIGVMLVEAALSIVSVYAPALQVYSIDAAVKSIFALGILIAMFEFAGDDIILIINKNIEIVGKLLAIRPSS